MGFSTHRVMAFHCMFTCCFKSLNSIFVYQQFARTDIGGAGAGLWGTGPHSRTLPLVDQH